MKMNVSVSLNKKLVEEVKCYAVKQSRSVPKQIEYWIRAGQIAEENESMPYCFIREVLHGLEDVKNGKVERYEEGKL